MIGLIVVLVIIASIVFIIENNKKSKKTTYVIRKDKHICYHGLKFAILKDSIFNFEVIFTNSCRYISKISENQYDVNKLYGFADSNNHVHKHSARFGWLWDIKVNKIALYSYCYVDGVRKFTFLEHVDLNKKIQLSIILNKDSYIFNTENVKYIEKRSSNIGGVKGVHIKLFPYFGGDETAPHDITIKIKDLF